MKKTTFNYQRIVIKLGTNLLTGGSGRLNERVMSSLVEQIATTASNGIMPVLVSSGAIAAGEEALGITKGQRDIPFKQIMAAVGQSRLMRLYQELFDPYGLQVAQVLITRSDLDNREGYLNARNTLEGLVNLGVVPIVNENDVLDIREIGQVIFGDNDSLSAAVANLVDADLLILLTDQDGLYTQDPRKSSSAKLIEHVPEIDPNLQAMASKVGTSRGRGGMAAKLEAARTATEAGISVVIANGQVPQVITRLLAKESIGTFFDPTSNRQDSRRRWLLSGLGAKGEIAIDDGAVDALLNTKGSLLPAGIRHVKGDFGRGEIVDIYDTSGNRLGSGLVQYSASDLEQIKGARTSAILRILGYKYADEIVHRNDMAFLKQ